MRELGRRTILLGALVSALVLSVGAVPASAAILSFSVTTQPAGMTLNHTTAGTTSAVLHVAALLGWTITIKDNAGVGANAGHLLRSGSPLANPLQWSADNLSFNNLTGTAATVAQSGGILGLTADVTVYFKQTLGASEAVTAGNAYSLTVLWTAT